MKSKTQVTATLGFEDKIWKACDSLRGHIPASDYRKVIVGLIFIRSVSDAFTKQYEKLVADGEGFENDRDAYTADHVFFVPKKARWDVIQKAAHTAEIGKVLDDAMAAIEKENDSIKGCLPKIYDSPAIDKRVLGEVVDLFTNEIKLGDVRQSRDLLGKTYQYCIKNFALHEGQKGGEFYTPECIDEILVAVIDPQPNDRLFEPCCGSGGLIVQSDKVVKQKAGETPPPQGADWSIWGRTGASGGGWSERQADFARAVLCLKSRVDPRYGTMRLKELADDGDEDAKRFLKRR